MKKYLFGALAVVLAVGFSAFTKKEVKAVDAKQTVLYYVFNAASACNPGKRTLHIIPVRQPVRDCLLMVPALAKVRFAGSV